MADRQGRKGDRMGITRRTALRGLASTATFAVAGGALAQAVDPISQALQRSSEWSDSFDSTAANQPNVRTAAPVFSPETLAATHLAVQQYSEIAARGGWPQVPAGKELRLGVRDPAVIPLRERLIMGGDISGGAGMSDSFDSYVDSGIRRFQARHGIPPDGIVGASTFSAMNVPADARLAQLAKNVDRLKPHATNPEERFVMVNIPAAQIEAVEVGRVVSRHTAVVGKIDRPSPIVNSKITEINFNPFWTVPVSIIRRDLIPLMRKQPNYLTAQHIHVYDRKGNELQPEQIDWNTEEAVNYLFRQDPGPWNSMGSVKINFPSPDGVYMHDTPNKGLFNEDFRFDSSGCVRVQNIRQLISWILKDTPGWTRPQVDHMFRVSDRLDVRVKNPVPVHWLYLTGWAMADGVVHFRDDIYLQDGIGQLALMTHPAAAAAHAGGATGPAGSGAAGYPGGVGAGGAQPQPLPVGPRAAQPPSRAGGGPIPLVGVGE